MLVPCCMYLLCFFFFFFGGGELGALGGLGIGLTNPKIVRKNTTT